MSDNTATVIIVLIIVLGVLACMSLYVWRAAGRDVARQRARTIVECQVSGADYNYDGAGFSFTVDCRLPDAFAESAK